MTVVREVRLKLYPKKFDRAREFYQSVLGFSIQKEWDRAPNDRGVMFVVGNVVLELLSPISSAPVQGCGVSLQVDDVHTLWDKLKEHESISFALRHNDWGDTSFAIYDPEGFEVTFFTKDTIVIKESSFDEVAEIEKTIVEFSSLYGKAVFEKRTQGREYLSIVAYDDKKPAGYLIGYADGDVWYCWVVGVSPNHRRKGILKGLMKYQEDWVKQRNHKTIRIKTRNKFRSMLSYLVKHGFEFSSVQEKEAVEENRILLEKQL